MENENLKNVINVEVEITPSSLTLGVGKSAYLEATVSPGGAKQSVTWSSSNTSIATVNPDSGLVLAQSVGDAIIYATAQDGSGATASCPVYVRPRVESITVSPRSATMDVGTTMTMSATVCPTNAVNKTVKWRSSDETVATVGLNSGVVTAISPGTASIEGITVDVGWYDSCEVKVQAASPIAVQSITVYPSEITMDIGDTSTLNATVLPENATNKTIRWTSANSTIAEVDEYTGAVTAIAKGSVTICAAAQDCSGVCGYCEVTINGPVMEDTVPGLKAIKQCRIRKEMSMDDSAILKDSSGTNVKLNVDDTVPLLSSSTITANDRVWYRILYNGMMLHVTADDNSFEEIRVPSPSTPEGRDIFANPGLDSNINIRSTPSESNDNVIGQFSHGTTLTLTCNSPQNSEWFAVYGKSTSGNYTHGWCSGKHLAYYFLNTIRDCYVRTSMVISSSTILKDSAGKSVVLREDTVDSIRLWKLGKLTGGEYGDHNGNIRNDWYMVEYNGQIAYVTADSFYLFDFGEPMIDENQGENNPSGGNATVMPARASNNCLEFIIDYEDKNFWPTARDDGYGNLTIGYGHVVKNGESFGTITEEEALELFAQDISSTETMVKNYSNNRNKIWSQQEYDAFVSLAYNAGTAVASVMDEIIDGIDPYEAFSKICNASGEFSLGLYRRRMDEADIFVNGEYQREDRDAP